MNLRTIIRANAVWRAYEPAIAAIAVVAAFGAALHAFPALGPALERIWLAAEWALRS